MLRRRRPSAEPRPPVPQARWTEHGPEPLAPDPEPAPDETAPTVEASSDGPVADRSPPVTLAMPEVPGDVRPAAPAATAPPAPADEAAGRDVDSVKARLAARGLVRTEPSVRIRDVAGPAADAPARIAPTKGDPFEPEPPREEAVGEDAEALEPEPFGPTALTRCPSCRTTQQVAIDATGYRCDNCDKVWRWGICTSCSQLSLTIARQESWRCANTSCGAFSRSWWRTATAPREAQEVTRRKRAEAADRERQRVLDVARRRRWKLILAGLVIVLLAGASALIFSSTDASSPAEDTQATCATWTRLKSDIANGALSASELDAALADLAADAETAEADVQLAASELADAGRPGQAAFLVASTQLSDACAANR